MRSAVVALATDESASREHAAMLANGLCAAGRAITLVWVSERRDHPIAPPPVAAGVEILVINADESEQRWSPEYPLLNLACHIAPALREFEVVYGLTLGHPLMHAIRERRHSPAPLPYFVAVLDKAREHQGPTLSAGEIARRFGEKYVLTHCDLIVCLAATGYQQLMKLGVAAPASRVLSSSDETLQSIFDEVDKRARAIAAARTGRAGAAMGAASSSLTICLSHSEDSRDAAGVLKALDQQSIANFSVIGIDSSTSIGSAAIFAAEMAQYRGRGWTYRHEPQRGEARAIALSVASVSTEYLMFIDTSDELEPRCVERAVEAAELSGDDLLEIWSAELADADEMSSTQYGPTSAHSPVMRASYGVDLVNAMGGGGNRNPIFVVRRKAFDAVGGYPVGLVAGREREALAVRIAMAGYCCDVLPEILNARRVTRNKATRQAIREGDSLRSAFDERLNTINMQSFAMTVQAVAQQLRETEHEVEARQRDLGRRFAVPAVRERLRLLMLVSSFPCPPTSSFLRRRWAMIRFLGQRHDLTLATFCSSEQSRHRTEVLRYCRSIYAAESGGPELPEADRMPALVRKHMCVTMRDALRSIPSDLYDAALIDTTYLAPFGVEIEAPTILGVQDIGSRLPAQAAQLDVPGSSAMGGQKLEHDAELMRDYEDEVWPQFATRFAVTAQDRDDIQLRARTGQTILVENGGDLDLWLADARSNTNRIIFFGDLDAKPNIDAILHFWHNIRPHLVSRRPSVELVVAGSCAAADLRHLAKQPGLVLVEDPTDIRQVAATVSVSIAPLRFSSGTSLNILESMALGLPVVSTSIGCAGLPLKDGEHVLVRDDAAGFADAVDQLLGSASMWRRLRRNGNAVIGERYRWDRVLAPLESELWHMAR